MCRKWKRAAALWLAVLLGCMVPMGTMLAAEDKVEAETESVSDNDMSDGDVPDGEDVSGKEEAADTGDENTSNDQNVDLTQMAWGSAVAEPEPDVVSNAVENSEGTDAPEIVITRGGADKTCSPGGKIDFEYVNYWGTMFEVSVSPSNQDVSVYCYPEKVKDTTAEARTEEQMGLLSWGEKQSPPFSIESYQDGCYVVYVKVEADGKTYYARSSGIVADTVKPVIKGVEAGKSYPEGTLFQVEDANLDYVLVNEQPAVSENGSYKVVANGTSCVVRAKDKAGNEETCSIVVFGEDKPGEDTPGEDKPGEDTPGEDKPGEDKPGEDTPGEDTPDKDIVISQSGEYALKAGVKYHLAEGKWRLDSDKSVYKGGNDFYVNVDGNYTFSR